MRRKVLVLGSGMMLATGMATPAAAAPLCAGTENTVVFCVDPTGGAPIVDCIYVGPPPCIPVSIPTPSFGCGGDIGQGLCASIRLT